MVVNYVREEMSLCQSKEERQHQKSYGKIEDERSKLGNPYRV
jgi:hypothetical protein